MKPHLSPAVGLLFSLASLTLGACDKEQAPGGAAAQQPTSPALPAANPNPALTEKAKIETLITQLETLTDAKFIRNNSEYDAKSAAKFLRGKWSLNESDIKTAKDFIAKSATASSAGKPYMIRFKDGTEKACSDYLTERLKKLEEPKAAR